MRHVPREVLAHHEAAHAVTGETLFPGDVAEIVMVPTPEKKRQVGLGSSVEALAWVWWRSGAHVLSALHLHEFAVVTYAGKWAERRIGWTDPWTTQGDHTAARFAVWDSLDRARASLKAKTFVNAHWDTIARLAQALGHVDIMPGDQVREIVAAGRLA